MGVKRIVRVASIAAAAVGTARAARRLGADRSDREYRRALGNTTFHEVGTRRIQLPVIYHRSEGLEALFSADEDAIRSILPSGLHPVRLPGGRAVVAIGGYRHLELTCRDAAGRDIGALPYGEVAVGAFVTRRPMPPLLPLAIEGLASLAPGTFVLQLPVTSLEARDAGRLLWGFPKYLADIAFEDDLSWRSVTVEEDGRMVLRLEVRATGRSSESRAPAISHSVRDGRLLETVAPWRQVRIRELGQAGRLRLGDHPMAGAIRELGVAERPFIGQIVVGQRFLLPEGRDIGPAEAPPWYAGQERDLASFTIRYPDLPVTDLYRERREAAASPPS
jgi:hypothetical protein